MGRERLEYYMADYKKRSDTLTKKEQDTVKDMKIVQEMYARGFSFTEVDLYKAADAVVLAARDGQFLSKDDFRQRTKVSKSVIDFMDDLHIFGDIPESNQISLFDFQ